MMVTRTPSGVASSGPTSWSGARNRGPSAPHNARSPFQEQEHRSPQQIPAAVIRGQWGLLVGGAARGALRVRRRLERMRREVLVLVCDFCKVEDEEGTDVRRREVPVDDGVLAIEACGKCWEKRTKPIRLRGRLMKRRRKSAWA